VSAPMMTTWCRRQPQAGVDRPGSGLNFRQPEVTSVPLAFRHGGDIAHTGPALWPTCSAVGAKCTPSRPRPS
jgi:hypothetical protein